MVAALVCALVASGVLAARARGADPTKCGRFAAQSVKRAGHTDAAFVRYLTWLDGYLAQRRCSDPEVRSALRAALREYRQHMHANEPVHTWS